MNQFVKTAKEQSKFTETENGGVALSTTDSKVLDLFAKSGSMRTTSQAELESSIRKSFNEDDKLTRKLVFYTRDILEGLGERTTSRKFYKYLAEHDTENMRKNLALVPEFGRWDDYLVFFNTDLEKDVLRIIVKQLKQDLENVRKGNPISLAGKWMPKPNANQKENRLIANKIARAMGMTRHEYQKALTKLRQEGLKIVETRVVEENFKGIEYSKVPSQAMLKYNNIFMTKDEENFKTYLDQVNKGETKINAKTLFPYELVREYVKTTGSVYIDTWMMQNFFAKIKYNELIETQWKNLPDYVTDTNAIVVADTSGSMTSNNCLPMFNSISLAVYFAERNKGVFKDLFITFSSEARFQELGEATLIDNLRKIDSIVENTNFESVYNLILKHGIENHVPQEDMPETIIVISDMQMDYARNDYRKNRGKIATFNELMKEKYEEHGYKMPKVVYWNVDARDNNTVQVSKDDTNTMLVSGSSTNTLKTLLNTLTKTPYEYMLEVLNSERYAVVE